MFELPITFERVDGFEQFFSNKIFHKLCICKKGNFTDFDTSTIKCIFLQMQNFKGVLRSSQLFPWASELSFVFKKTAYVKENHF